MKHRVCLLVFLLSATTAYSQKDIHTVYWLRYQNQLNFSEKISWNNEIDNRRFIDPDVQTQLITHSRVHYRKHRWDYATGLTLSWAFASRPDDPTPHATLELRPVAEASYEIPLRKWYLLQRVRMDNRFFEEDKYTTDFSEATYVARFRYRIQARFNLSKESKLGIRVADEIMFNDRENTFDQNRIYVTSEYVLSKAFNIETGYIHIYQQRFGTEHFFQRHVLRFSIIHKLFLY